MHLKTIKSYFAGGRPLALRDVPAIERVRVPGEAPVTLEMNGTHMVGQLYAQHFCVAQPVSSHPVVLMHGGGLSGTFWEADAEGNEGWLQAFLRAGFDTVVVDAFERGRAGFPPVPHVLPDAPHHRTLEDMWAWFRLGQADGFVSGKRHVPFPGQQFPAEHFESYAQRFVPRWAGTEAQALAAYAELLDMIGPCTLVGHSQGAYYSLMLAQRFPDIVRQVVAIEPPATPDEPAVPTHPRHLAIWGDYIDGSDKWVRYRAKHIQWAQRLSHSRSRDDGFINLPSEGIHGNSHLIVPERNNRIILARILQWLAA